MATKDQPFTYQENANYHNGLAVDLELGKFGDHRAAIKEVLSNHECDRTSERKITADIFNAASRGLWGVSDMERLLSRTRFLIEHRPFDVGLVLLLVHFCIMTDDTAGAVGALMQLFYRLEASPTPTNTSARFSPGLIAMLVTPL